MSPSEILRAAVSVESLKRAEGGGSGVLIGSWVVTARHTIERRRGGPQLAIAADEPGTWRGVPIPWDAWAVPDDPAIDLAWAPLEDPALIDRAVPLRTAGPTTAEAGQPVIVAATGGLLIRPVSEAPITVLRSGLISARPRVVPLSLGLCHGWLVETAAHPGLSGAPVWWRRRSILGLVHGFYAPVGTDIPESGTFRTVPGATVLAFVTPLDAFIAAVEPPPIRPPRS